jgi:hypothetical protein
MHRRSSSIAAKDVLLLHKKNLPKCFKKLHACSQSFRNGKRRQTFYVLFNCVISVFGMQEGE